jgi:hypothetical protein
MAYTVSVPRRQFDKQLKEIVRRLKGADAHGVTTDLREYAIAAGIFLAHAEIENYFVDLLSRLANLYSSPPLSASRLPIRLRAHLALSKSNAKTLIANAFAGREESDVLATIERWFQPSVACYFDDGLAYPTLSGADIYGRYDYPSKRNLVKVLRRIGIGDPPGQLNSIANRDVISLLESVASLRTSLAHSATLTGVSCSDAISRINGLKAFVAALDRLLYRHSTTTHPSAYWKTNLC